MTNEALLQNIADILVQRNETIAIAESVTAGLLMAQLSLAKKATEFFQGGVTAYNIGQKTRQLSVDPILGEKTNCVSELISTQMAIHVARQFCSQWGIGVTGYAVPVPQLGIRKCFAFYAITYNGSIVEASRIDSSPGSQRSVQMQFARQILRKLCYALKS